MAWRSVPEGGASVFFQKPFLRCSSGSGILSSVFSRVSVPVTLSSQVVRQELDAVRVEALSFQRFDARQHFFLLQIDHRKGQVQPTRSPKRFAAELKNLDQFVGPMRL
jgi:hypothetical protein